MSGTSLRPIGGRRFGGNPFDIFDVVQDLNRNILREFFGGQGQQQERSGGRLSLIPAAEVIEDDDAYRIALEIPGIDPQQVEVNLTGHTLTVQAERREHLQSQQGQQEGGQQRQQEGGQQGQQRERQSGQQGGQQRERRTVLLSEIAYGHVRRTFEFQSEIDTNRAQAEFRNGLLTITLHKSAQARDQQRRIEVKAS